MTTPAVYPYAQTTATVPEGLVTTEKAEILNKKNFSGLVALVVILFLFILATTALAIYISIIYTNYRKSHTSVNPPNPPTGDENTESWQSFPLSLIIVSSVTTFLAIVLVSITAKKRYVVKDVSTQVRSVTTPVTYTI